MKDRPTEDLRAARAAKKEAAPSGRLEVVLPAAAVVRREFAQTVREGLCAERKFLGCEFFYDAQGSKLFEQICDLPEYYPTRSEEEILRVNTDAILAGVPPGLTLVELGSGSAAKTRVLIEGLLARHGSLRYVPIDISPTMLETSSRALLEDYPGLTVLGLASEYQEGLRQLRERVPGRKLVLWLGSNVGNFERRDAAHFLARVRDLLDPGDRFLMGVDLRKDLETLERAYDDDAGVTARFNLNLLARINRELGGHFDLARFRHEAHYDAVVGRVEMHLVSTARQSVAIDKLDLTVEFDAGEAVHTENSYKYSLHEIETLAQQGRFELTGQWLDRAKRFSLNRLKPA